MFLTAKELGDGIEVIIHEETQFSEKGIDLTVDEIFRVDSPTELDFGGSEEKLGERSKIKPEKRNPDDDYGWWELIQGLYVIEFNENITVKEGLGIIVPLSRLTSGGSDHRTLLFSGDFRGNVVLSVSSAGLNIKENARISRFKVWK